MIGKPECKDIVRVVLPAVRASVAETMHKRYGYNQERIAQRLGVVQVAVSKYLNGRYSKEISHMKDYISKNKLSDTIVDKIEKGGNRKEIDNAIDNLCDELVALNVA